MVSFDDLVDEVLLHILEFIPIQVSRYEFSLDLFRFSGISTRFYKIVWNERLKNLQVKNRSCIRYIFRKNVPEVILIRMLRIQTLSDTNTTHRNEIFIAAVCKGFTSVVDSYLNDKNYEIDPSEMDNEALREASKEGQLEMVRLLVKDPRVDPSAEGNQALYSSARGNYIELAKFLLSDKRVMDGEGVLEAADYASSKEMENLIRKKHTKYQVEKSFRETVEKLTELLDIFREEFNARFDGYVLVRTLSSLQNWVKRHHRDMNRVIDEFKKKCYYLPGSDSRKWKLNPFLPSTQRDEYNRALSGMVDQFGVIPVPSQKKKKGGPVGEDQEDEEEEDGMATAAGMLSSYYVGFLDLLHSRPQGKGMIYDMGAYHSTKLRVTGEFCDGLIHGGRTKEYHSSNGSLKWMGKYESGFRSGRGVEFELDGRTVKKRGVWRHDVLIQEDNRIDVTDSETWLELPVILEEEKEESEEEEIQFDDEDDDDGIENLPPPPNELIQPEEERDGEYQEVETKGEDDEGEEEGEMKSTEEEGTISVGTKVDLDKLLESSILYQSLNKTVEVHSKKMIQDEKKIRLMFDLIKENRKTNKALQASLESLREGLGQVREAREDIVEESRDGLITKAELTDEIRHNKKEVIRMEMLIEKNRMTYWDSWKGLLLSFFLGIVACYSYVLFFGLGDDEK